MKTTLRLLTVASAVALASCGGEQAPEAVTTPAQEVKKDTVAAEAIRVDTLFAQTDVSSILWKCSKPASTHNGLIKISKGWLGLSDNKIVAGAFTIDMKTIADLDIKDAKKNKDLVTHLSSKDFFETETFPTVDFVITSANDSTITGNLTLKGKTNSVTFPYKAQHFGAMTVANAKFSIDRSKWGIVYNAKSIAGISADKIISDLIELEVALSAAKK
ncbi:MAG: YceI family protein [Flavobacteriales bacterium]